jgi:hypothetical protein
MTRNGLLMTIVSSSYSTAIATPPTDPGVKYREGGIPNWSTAAPVPVGNAYIGPRDTTPTPFVLSSFTVGQEAGYSSLSDAITSVQELLGGTSPIVGITQRGDKWFGHELWAFTQKKIPLEPSTRLSGSTVTSYKPLPSRSPRLPIDMQYFHFNSGWNESLKAVVSAYKVYEVQKTPKYRPNV